MHVSVLTQEVIENLAIKPNDTVLDGTLGASGHSLLIAEILDPKSGALICCDVDQNALENAKKVLSPYIENGLSVTLYHGSFSEIANSNEYKDVKVDKILLDLGWSSNQFEDPERGFSFMNTGPLDMRLSFPGTGQTARDILHNSSEDELSEILFEFGEESQAKRIASSIVEERNVGTLETTADLVRIIESTIGRSGKIHPATKTFQALRIAVNHEIEAIIKGIPNLWSMLNSGGRLAVITFHSIEDRLVKQSFASIVADGKGKLINKHVITPSPAELARNPRSRSAKLRVIEKYDTNS